MRCVLTGRHVEITPALRKLVDGRLRKLDRMLGESLVSAQVVLARERYRYVVEVSAHARGDHVLHGVGSTASWDTATTAAVEKIMQQAQKVKGKWEERKRRAVPGKALNVPAAGAVTRESGRPSRRIVRASHYPIKPMTIDEAALEVGAAHDAFLVFRNAATDAINVLYRRKDGGLGLIEPEA
jgi:putative sigma-54 modulation protein